MNRYVISLVLHGQAKDGEGRENWAIRVEVKRVEDVVIPAVDGDRTYVDHGLAQLAGRELGAGLVDQLGGI